jgi:Flp pilus assembly protein TadD
MELDPSRFDVYGALGSLYASQKRLEEARAELEKLAKAQPRSAEASYTMVAMLYQLQNKTAEARTTYEKVLALNPRAGVAANNLAWIYSESGENMDMALQLAQTAKAQLPDRPEVNDTLGWIYYKKGLGSLAVSPLSESVQRDPKNPVYHYHLGLVYAKNGDNVHARQSLQHALELKADFDGAQDAKRVLASLPG